MDIRVDNTATSWNEFLVALALEADRDAEATDPQFALRGVLTDLALVARSYAGRLEIERGPELKQPVVAGAEAELVTEPAAATPVELSRSPSELPDWLLETLKNMGIQIEDLQRRVAYLEDNLNKVVIAPSPPFMLEEEINEDRDTWNSVGYARVQLRAMVNLEHKKRAASRQAIFRRVAFLASQPDRDGSAAAEIRQHNARAEELSMIDAVCGVKIDEIEALDDLLALREYDVQKGWPQ